MSKKIFIGLLLTVLIAPAATSGNWPAINSALAAETANGIQSVCSFSSDIMLAIDRSASMGYSSKCEYWQLQCINKPSCSLGYRWVQYTVYNKNQKWCDNRTQSAPRQSVWTEYNPVYLTATKQAANNFLNLLGANDQSGLVSFSTTATLNNQLSNNHSATQAAINSLSASGATNIGDGIKLAGQELLSDRANPSAAKIMILLTDGKANKPYGPGNDEEPRDAAYALAQAGAAVLSDIKIFTIGLGNDINSDVLERLAAKTGGQYYYAATGNDLDSAFNSLKTDLCAGQSAYCGDGIKNGEEQCDGQDGVGAGQYCSNECLLFNLPQSPDLPDLTSGMVTITFDDGNRHIYDHALPILSSRGLKAMYYAETSWLNSNEEWTIGWDETLELQNKWGWEIGSHTVNHPYLTQIPIEQVRYELIQSKQELEERGIRVESFATPYGDYNDQVLAEISKIYSSHRAAWSWGTPQKYPDINNYQLKSKEISHETSPETVKQWLSEAKANNEWLIFLLHDITDGVAGPYQYNIDDFAKVADYIVDSGLPVVNVTEVLSNWGSGDNLVLNSSFEQTMTDGRAENWTITGAVIDNKFNGVYNYPKNSLKFHICGDEQQTATTDLIKIDYNSNYRLRFWQHISLTGPAGNMAVWVDEFDVDGYYAGGQWLGTKDNSFIGTRYYDFIPDNGVNGIRISIYAPAGSHLTGFVDDAQLKLIQ